MSARTRLNTRREILLIGLRARRLGRVRRRVTLIVDSELPAYPRSAIMRFVLRQPHLCFWALRELLPLLSGRRQQGTLRRFIRACSADYGPVATIR